MARQSMMKSMRANLKSSKGFNNDLWTPMGQLDVGQSALVRLLPYQDEVSQGIWTIKKTLHLTFINPDDDEEEWTVAVPVMEMYDRTTKCPVTTIVRDLFKQAKELNGGGQSDEGKRVEKVALSHWIRYNFYYQGFVLSGGKEATDPNTIVPMMFPKSLHTIVQKAVEDDDSQFDTLPSGEFTLDDVALLMEGKTDPDMTDDEFMALFAGCALTVRKTEKGGYNNYESAEWQRKDHELSDEQLVAISENGFIDLRKYLPKQPTEEQYEIYAEMMEISIQAALGNCDNVWNPEWEEKYDIKPRKPDNNNSGSGNSGGDGSTSNVKERLKAKRANKDASDGTGSSDARSKLTASRGKAAEPTSVSDETVDENSSEEDESPKPAAKSALAKRLAAAKKNSSR